jgi:hypothetical protein
MLFETIELDRILIDVHSVLDVVSSSYNPTFPHTPYLLCNTSYHAGVTRPYQSVLQASSVRRMTSLGSRLR